ncbi:MAG: TrmH family RNA methyltransferase [Clostridia bacterium]|nr:TrmH family RNA methyltransferase [Clostridia bacterium]
MKRYKKEEPLSYTLGASLTFQLLEQRPDLAREVVMHPRMEGETAEKAQTLCKKLGIPFSVSEKPFNILSPKENCFLIGSFEKFSPALDTEKNHVVLVSPSNAGNLGTILRSCLGFGYQDVAIIRPAVDIFDPKTVRASMGALFGIRFAYFDTFAEYASAYGQERAYYPFMLQTDMPLHKTEFAARHALIFGNESSGLPAEFLELGKPVIIRHSQLIDSLNLPIAVSIALYEATKDRL